MRITPFVIGGLAGAALGALLAPTRGMQTRRALGRALGRHRNDDELPHRRSATALAAEALRTGTLPNAAHAEAYIPQEDGVLRMGDPDVDPLNAAYVGDEVAGGDMPTPDHDSVDEIGRAYGVSQMGEGELRSSAEILAERDRRR